MSEITAQMVKALREKTGAGMMDCKAALQETGGDMEQAVEFLRKKGLKDVGKRSGKVAAEGTLGVYIHPGNQVAVVVELNCETDFVAKGDEFIALASNLAMHIAALKPQYVGREDIPADILKKEEEIIIEQLNEKQRPMADKIVPGKLTKFFEEWVLLDQPYVRDDTGKKTVKDLVDELSAKVGEKIIVRRFQRYEVGEGVERAAMNFADEVASIAAG